jgi:hypothetical protein
MQNLRAQKDILLYFVAFFFFNDGERRIAATRSDFLSGVRKRESGHA